MRMVPGNRPKSGKSQQFLKKHHEQIHRSPQSPKSQESLAKEPKKEKNRKRDLGLQK